MIETISLLHSDGSYGVVLALSKPNESLTELETEAKKLGYTFINVDTIVKSQRAEKQKKNILPVDVKLTERQMNVLARYTLSALKKVIESEVKPGSRKFVIAGFSKEMSMPLLQGWKTNFPANAVGFKQNIKFCLDCGSASSEVEWIKKEFKINVKTLQNDNSYATLLL